MSLGGMKLELTSSKAPLPGQRSRTPSAHACFVSTPILGREDGVYSVFGVLRELCGTQRTTASPRARV